MNFKQENEFTVNSSSLKDIRNFARDLFEKVEYYLSHKEEREKIAERGKMKTKMLIKNFQYHLRLKK